MPPSPKAAPAPRRKIKKVAGHGGHHGGAWKVAYADFITAMMALFMVMWLLASTDAETRKEISNYFRTGILPDGDLTMQKAAQSKPSVIEEAPSTAKASNAPDVQQSMQQQADELEQAIANLVQKDEQLTELAKFVTVRVTPEGVLIEAVDHDGNEDLLFDLASPRLKPALTRFLVELAPVLGKRPNDLEVHGNTDARPFVSGSGKDNWDLSYERASAARRILEENGVRPGQVVGVVGRGAAQLYDPTNPLAASNRRLSILLRRPSVTAQKDAAPAPDDGRLAAAKVTAPAVP
jgi:chemotaxis protein MotB